MMTGGAVASWLVRTVRVRSLAGDIGLCSWAGHFTLTGTGDFNAGGNPAMD